MTRPAVRAPKRKLLRRPAAAPSCPPAADAPLAFLLALSALADPALACAPLLRR